MPRIDTSTLRSAQVDALAAYAVAANDETAEELGKALMENLGPLLTESILDAMMAEHAEERETARAELEAAETTPGVRVQ